MSKARWIKTGIISCALLALSGCKQVSLVRAWWQAWRNPTSVPSSQKQDTRNVSININAIARRHPAWKLAEIMEKTPSPTLQMNWQQPASATKFAVEKGDLFVYEAPAPHLTDFAEQASSITAATKSLQQSMTEKQRLAWSEWEKDINAAIATDRENTERAMRVDLRDAIEQTRQQIPENSDPLLLSERLQTELIHLRLKLLANIALTPEDKAATEARLTELESQWKQLLRQQAQEEADKQRYWRETVPRQLREEGEIKIQQTLRILQQNDQQSIDRILAHQSQILEESAADNPLYSLQQPEIRWSEASNKSTFDARAMETNSFLRIAQQLKTPQEPPADRPIIPPSVVAEEIRQLKQIALKAATRAASQSAARHGWNWVNSSNPPSSSSRSDATAVVLQEISFP